MYSELELDEDDMISEENQYNFIHTMSPPQLFAMVAGQNAKNF